MIRERIKALAPWHFDVEVQGVRTGDFRGSDMALVDERYEGYIRGRYRSLYPQGLEGRSVLDCGCNCGAYLFAAKDEGAGHCFGFDVREHWIKQARFLAEARGDQDIEFAVMHLEDLAEQTFDIVLFMGILYHLPDPLHGLKIAADRAREFLIINTSIRSDLPDGALVASVEDPAHPLSGAEGPNWYPTGVESLRPFLAWLGFPHVEVGFRVEVLRERDPNFGRIELLAGRRPFSFATPNQPS